MLKIYQEEKLEHYQMAEKSMLEIRAVREDLR